MLSICVVDVTDVTGELVAGGEVAGVVVSLLGEQPAAASNTMTAPARSAALGGESRTRRDEGSGVVFAVIVIVIVIVVDVVVAAAV